MIHGEFDGERGDYYMSRANLLSYPLCSRPLYVRPRGGYSRMYARTREAGTLHRMQVLAVVGNYSRAHSLLSYGCTYVASTHHTHGVTRDTMVRIRSTNYSSLDDTMHRHTHQVQLP